MLKRKSTYLLLYSIAMGLLEAAVVVYLRELYYPDNIREILPLRPFRLFDLRIELLREAATIIMLWFVAGLAELEDYRRRLFAFMAVWGIWDLTYYLWLKAFIGWPQSLMSIDVLFLLPVPWAAPVLAPVLFASAMAVAGMIVTSTTIEPVTDIKFWLMFLSGGTSGLISFLMAGAEITSSGFEFPWLLFGIGLALFSMSLIYSIVKGTKEEPIELAF